MRMYMWSGRGANQRTLLGNSEPMTRPGSCRQLLFPTAVISSCHLLHGQPCSRDQENVVNRVADEVDSNEVVGHTARLKTAAGSESVMRWLIITVCLASSLIGVSQAFPGGDDTVKPPRLPDHYAEVVLQVEGML